jgi:hypothetical protein
VNLKDHINTQITQLFWRLMETQALDQYSYTHHKNDLVFKPMPRLNVPGMRVPTNNCRSSGMATVVIDIQPFVRYLFVFVLICKIRFHIICLADQTLRLLQIIYSHNLKMHASIVHSHAHQHFTILLNISCLFSCYC